MTLASRMHCDPGPLVILHIYQKLWDPVGSIPPSPHLSTSFSFSLRPSLCFFSNSLQSSKRSQWLWSHMLINTLWNWILLIHTAKFSSKVAWKWITSDSKWHYLAHVTAAHEFPYTNFISGDLRWWSPKWSNMFLNEKAMPYWAGWSQLHHI